MSLKRFLHVNLCPLRHDKLYVNFIMKYYNSFFSYHDCLNLLQIYYLIFYYVICCSNQGCTKIIGREEYQDIRQEPVFYFRQNNSIYLYFEYLKCSLSLPKSGVLQCRLQIYISVQKISKDEFKEYNKNICQYCNILQGCAITKVLKTTIKRPLNMHFLSYHFLIGQREKIYQI